MEHHGLWNLAALVVASAEILVDNTHHLKASRKRQHHAKQLPMASTMWASHTHTPSMSEATHTRGLTHMVEGRLIQCLKHILWRMLLRRRAPTPPNMCHKCLRNAHYYASSPRIDASPLADVDHMSCARQVCAVRARTNFEQMCNFVMPRPRLHFYWKTACRSHGLPRPRDCIVGMGQLLTCLLSLAGRNIRFATHAKANA